MGFMLGCGSVNPKTLLGHLDGLAIQGEGQRFQGLSRSNLRICCDV